MSIVQAVENTNAITADTYGTWYQLSADEATEVKRRCGGRFLDASEQDDAVIFAYTTDDPHEPTSDYFAVVAVDPDDGCVLAAALTKAGIEAKQLKDNLIDSIGELILGQSNIRTWDTDSRGRKPAETDFSTVVPGQFSSDLQQQLAIDKPAAMGALHSFIANAREATPAIRRLAIQELMDNRGGEESVTITLTGDDAVQVDLVDVARALGVPTHEKMRGTEALIAIAANGASFTEIDVRSVAFAPPTYAADFSEKAFIQAHEDPDFRERLEQVLDARGRGTFAKLAAGDPGGAQALYRYIANKDPDLLAMIKITSRAAGLDEFTFETENRIHEVARTLSNLTPYGMAAWNNDDDGGIDFTVTVDAMLRSLSDRHPLMNGGGSFGSGNITHKSLADAVSEGLTTAGVRGLDNRTEVRPPKVLVSPSVCHRTAGLSVQYIDSKGASMLTPYSVERAAADLAKPHGTESATFSSSADQDDVLVTKQQIDLAAAVELLRNVEALHHQPGGAREAAYRLMAAMLTSPALTPEMADNIRQDDLFPDGPRNLAERMSVDQIKSIAMPMEADLLDRIGALYDARFIEHGPVVDHLANQVASSYDISAEVLNALAHRLPVDTLEAIGEMTRAQSPETIASVVGHDKLERPAVRALVTAHRAGPNEREALALIASKTTNRSAIRLMVGGGQPTAARYPEALAILHERRNEFSSEVQADIVDTLRTSCRHATNALPALKALVGENPTSFQGLLPAVMRASNLSQCGAGDYLLKAVGRYDELDASGQTEVASCRPTALLEAITRSTDHELQARAITNLCRNLDAEGAGAAKGFDAAIAERILTSRCQISTEAMDVLHRSNIPAIQAALISSGRGEVRVLTEAVASNDSDALARIARFSNNPTMIEIATTMDTEAKAAYEARTADLSARREPAEKEPGGQNSVAAPDPSSSRSLGM